MPLGWVTSSLTDSTKLASRSRVGYLFSDRFHHIPPVQIRPHLQVPGSIEQAASASATRLIGAFELLLTHGGRNGRLRRFVGAISLFAADLETLEVGDQARLAGALGDELRELVALRRSLEVASPVAPSAPGPGGCYGSYFSEDEEDTYADCEMETEATRLSEAVR